MLCVVLLLWVATRHVAPAAPGVGFAAVNGLGALRFADLEYMGLRRPTPALA
jgi:hypothetical protein